MREDTHLGVLGTIAAHHERVGSAFGKVSAESVVMIACVINCFVTAGSWVIVGCNNPPFPLATSRKALLKEAVPHPKLQAVQRGGGYVSRAQGSLCVLVVALLVTLRLQQTLVIVVMALIECGLICLERFVS